MTLKVVGAGLGRTGTASLKEALERLIGGRCYHMMEVFGRPDDVPVWHRAALGEAVDWNGLLAEFDATVDWPGSAFWREISAANPDALVLLSVRSSPEAWWKSAHDTIFEATTRDAPPEMAEWAAMILALLGNRFTADWNDPEAAMAAYERHNAAVRAEVPADRLLEWRPGDGWAPIAAALGVPVPDEPFPHSNSTEEFRLRAGFDAPHD